MVMGVGLLFLGVGCTPCEEACDEKQGDSAAMPASPMDTGLHIDSGDTGMDDTADTTEPDDPLLPAPSPAIIEESSALVIHTRYGCGRFLSPFQTFGYV